MKFIRYKGGADTDTPYFCIGTQPENGPICRIATFCDVGEEADRHSRRIISALNACEGISDRTLDSMAGGGTKVGDLAERTMIVSQLFHYAPRVYERMRKLALETIRKDGGKV